MEVTKKREKENMKTFFIVLYLKDHFKIKKFHYFEQFFLLHITHVLVTDLQDFLSFNKE